MTRRTSINITLDEREAATLAAVAEKELRHPRDQARYLLRLGLGLAGGESPAPVTVKCDGGDLRAVVAGAVAS